LTNSLKYAKDLKINTISIVYCAILGIGHNAHIMAAVHTPSFLTSSHLLAISIGPISSSLQVMFLFFLTLIKTHNELIASLTKNNPCLFVFFLSSIGPDKSKYINLKLIVVFERAID